MSIERIHQEWKAKPRLWHQVLLIGVFYALYTLVRNVHGSILSINQAEKHAADIVSLEQTLHVFHEKQMQDWFLPHRNIIKFFDVWYGTVHFIMTIGVLLWLYHMRTDRYRKWRNVIIGTTLFALVGYLVYPLAPPRLLPGHYGFVDTLDTVGGLWNFNSSAVAKASNQYAAMPSLHTGWSLWCAFALWPTLKHWWSKLLIAIYPCITITAIIVTANHYWADVAGGVLTLVLGFAMATAFDRRRRSSFYRRLEEASRLAHHDESDGAVRLDPPAVGAS
jgi:membrane-associated phospholipid phosphatase